VAGGMSSARALPFLSAITGVAPSSDILPKPWPFAVGARTDPAARNGREEEEYDATRDDVRSLKRLRDFTKTGREIQG
jgi:hypothetical protein